MAKTLKKKKVYTKKSINVIKSSAKTNARKSQDQLKKTVRLKDKTHQNTEKKPSLLPQTVVSVIEVAKKSPPATLCSSSCCYNLIRDVAATFGMLENLTNWNVYWTDVFISIEKYQDMKHFQRINHFPGMLEICRKDLLARKLNRMANRFPHDYNFFPRTWCLPNEYATVLNYSRFHRHKIYITKPCLGSKGRGIGITKQIEDCKSMDNTICQLYVSKPLLVDGYKFDYRIYVLLTCCDPLRIYVYNEGLARFATEKYKENDEGNFSDKFMHLTNYSVNRKSSLFVTEGEESSKRKISTINQWLENNNHNVKDIWNRIDDSVIKTILLALPTLKHCYHICFPNHTEKMSACFELLGFDFMLDSKLKPYLIEVNHSPSFNTPTPVDREVKNALIHDTFCILNLASNDRSPVPDDSGYGVKEAAQWEETHLGNFRKVYPCKNEDKYKRYIRPRERMIKRSQKVINDAMIDEIRKKRKNPFEFKTGMHLTGTQRRLAKREFLMQSHNLMNKFYVSLKESEEKRLQDLIDLGRSNVWDLENEFNDQYANHKKSFTNNIMSLLKSISQKTYLENFDKEILSSLFLCPDSFLQKGFSTNKVSHVGKMMEEINDFVGPS